MTVDLNQFVGISFVPGGCSLSGCNCGGLVLLVFAAFGQRVTVPGYTGDHADSAAVNRIMEQERGNWEPLAEPEVPCLVAIAVDLKNPDWVNHVGVYIGNGRFLHSWRRTRSCVEKIDSLLWRNRIKGFYRWKNA